MSQTGKVLHVYVEVRSVCEEQDQVLGGPGGGDGSSHLMLQCPDDLPQSPRSSARSSPVGSPGPSSVVQRRSPSSKPSSRHSISFQLQSPDTTRSLTPLQNQDQDLLDTFGHLLEVLRTSNSESLGRARSPDVHPHQGGVPISPSSTCSSRLTLSPPSNHKPCGVSEEEENQEGKTSVVSFGYIEKSSVHSVAERRSAVGLNRPNRTFTRGEGHLLPPPPEDPIWYSRQLPEGGAVHRKPHPSHCHQGLPRVARGTVDAVAKSATCRALEEFGSPELRRRFAGPGPPNSSPTLPRHCQTHPSRSLGGSPILSHSTLPSKNHLLELDRHICRSSVKGLPRSPASNHLCAQTGHSTFSAAPTPTLSSPRLTSSRFHPPLPAGRPTDIQHEVPTGTPNSCSSGYQAGNSHRGVTRPKMADTTDGVDDVENWDGATFCKPPGCSSRASDVDSLISDPTSPSPNPELDWRPFSRTSSPISSQVDVLRSDSPNTRGSYLQANAHWRSDHEPLQVDGQDDGRKAEELTPGTEPGPISALVPRTDPSTPGSRAVPARWTSTLASSGPDLQHQQCTEDLSTLHRYRTPQYTGNCRVPATECKNDTRHLYSHNTEGLPVSWTSRKKDWRDSRDGEGNRRSPPGTRSKQETQRPVQTVFNGRSEGPDHGGGASSQSSSGVTGSLPDGSQVERSGSVTPETWSQLSQDQTAGGSGMQADSSAAARSQRIARAKWEFLFGDQANDGRWREEAPPPTDTSPAPTPPTSLRPKPSYQRRGRGRGAARGSHYQVQQVEVELVTASLRGPAPRTGIIRRSVKYSETDLDAVPLRCYRETDLDEVMRAEAEPAEEADSAFGSNRSILGKSSFSPTDFSPKSRTGGGREEDGEEEVVSWASVRMQGDRQRAARDQDQVFSQLLEGAGGAWSDPHGGLKSPVSVGGPRRPSDTNLDSFSRHFESIMESHRAKGTSYSSLDSVDLLTSGSTSVFTFHLPTLTPEIQSQICDSARQIELSFAPLARPVPELSRSEASLGTSGPRGRPDRQASAPVRSKSERDSWRRSILKDGFRKASSVPSLHSGFREHPGTRPPELLQPQAAVAERLARGGSDDALTNGLAPDLPDLPAARRLARRLYGLDGFRKSDVAPHLSKNNEFSHMVAEEYLAHFDFSGLTIDQALRMFLKQFALMGETQERERVLTHFSRRYRRCNPESLSTEDSVHTLTCAVMLLNTDLHGNNVGKRMSCSQFISNLEGLNDGRDFPRDQLKTLYSSIKNEKLQWTIDEEVLRKSSSELGEVRTDSASHAIRRVGSGKNLLVGVAQQADGELYKSGFLVRKVHADPDGKRTPRGRRGWRSYHAVLKGLLLYLQKDECRAERGLTEEEVKSAVAVHHALAMRAADYRKRPHVFYLRTADWRVFLFQAPNGEQMQSWITRINLVAAMLSAPPFPAAIGSQKRFSRPLLPGSSTRLSQEEQVQAHENRFRAVSSELLELGGATPDRKVKGRELEEQKVRKEYLEFEKTRYGTYAMLLRAKLSSGVEDLAAFEARLYDDGGLQRAHSSPTLPQDAAIKEKLRGAKTSRSLKVAVSSTPGTAGGENGQRAELQKQSGGQEEVA